jgi:hypothetical protein
MAPPINVVVGTVSGIVGTLNTLKTWFVDIRKFCDEGTKIGQALRRFESDIDDDETKLDTWMQLWGLESKTSQRYQRELFGSKALKTLSRKVLDITENISFIQNDVLEFMIKNKIPRSNLKELQNARASPSSVTAAREEQVSAQRQASVGSIIYFVDTCGPELTRRQALVKEALTELDSMALKAFAAKNKVNVSNALSEEQTEKIQRSVRYLTFSS